MHHDRQGEGCTEKCHWCGLCAVYRPQHTMWPGGQGSLPTPDKPVWRTPPKISRALRWAGACILIGAGFSMALLLSSYVYSHIYVQGAQACERWYEDESDWGKLPEDPV